VESVSFPPLVKEDLLFLSSIENKLFKYLLLIMATNNNNIDIAMNNLNLQSEVLGGSSKLSTNNGTPEDSSVAAISGIASQNATTTFVDDAHITQRDDTHVAHLSSSIFNLNDSQQRAQDLMDFLSKPIVIQQGNFSISDTYAFFSSLSMPYGAFNAAQGVVWNQKLAGFFGIRMDMRFKLVINANPFQQGRYALGWTPLAGMSRTTSQLKAFNVNNMHNASLVQRTTVPHVEIDISSGTSAELLVPFVSTTSFYPLNAILAGNDENTLGFINLYPYSPLVSPAGSTVASYTLYVSFENISLFGAASAQSAFRKKKGNPEVAQKGMGPISGIATSISKGFKEFTTIPLIGGVATDVAWIADRVASVASIFGFSKPNAGSNATRMEIVNAPTHSTVDGDSNARSLAMYSQPGVSHLDGLSGTDYDEMDFSYIVRKYAWFKTLTYSTSSPVGTLATLDVNPRIGVVVNSGVVNFTPVTFVSAYFQNWRGSLKYRFKIVKTPFHSGRLAFSFYPTDESSYVANPAYVNRIIVDIREKSDVEIIVPYISRHPWHPCDVAVNTRTGVLVVEVVDPLIAPATVSSSVSLLVELAGGDDMEFSLPNDLQLQPINAVPQSAFEKPAGQEDTIISATVGSSSVTSDPIIHASTCIGEKITSFRPFLRRFYPVRRGIVGPTYTDGEDTSQLNFIPDIIQGTTQTTGMGSFIQGDPYSTIGACYALSRGGVRIRDVLDMGLIQTGAAATPATVQATMGSLATNMSVTLIPLLNFGSPTKPFVGSAATADDPFMYSLVMQNMSQNNTITVEVPQYTSGYARAVGDIINFSTTTPGVGTSYNATSYSSNSKCTVNFNLPASFVSNLSNPNGYSLHNLYRSMADDASFSTFVSVPSLAPTSTTKKFGFY
jgi:hypothetical protein